jgi:hypothetical protein
MHVPQSVRALLLLGMLTDAELPLNDAEATYIRLSVAESMIGDRIFK